MLYRFGWQYKHPHHADRASGFYSLRGAYESRVGFGDDYLDWAQTRRAAAPEGDPVAVLTQERK